MPNPALATIVALTPTEAGVQYRLCDEEVGPLDLETPCDLVAVTGMTVDAERVEQICRAFRDRGVPVALGGAFATLEAERCKGMADHHFIGEAENTWPLFLEQWLRGDARATYRQEGHVDMGQSPCPDWSLIRPEDYIQVGIQTSRGCPNRCDFCDVVQYVGSEFRVKEDAQVLKEVAAAHALGFRGITLSDDNFIGDRRRARGLLSALGAWNARQAEPVTFSTQVTLQVADDEELLRGMAEAPFRFLFLGLETLRKQGLREVNKTPNLTADPRARLERIVSFGLVPFLGIIVGFDADDEGVFQELERFAAETASPIVASSLLNAPPGTPLYHRLEGEGRLAGDAFSGEWQMGSNVMFKNFAPRGLVRSNLEFLARVYAPEAFGERLMAWVGAVEHLPEVPADGPDMMARFVDKTGELLAFARANFTPDAFAMFRRCLKATLRQEPRLLPAVIDILGQYWHFHCFVRRATSSLG